MPGEFEIIDWIRSQQHTSRHVLVPACDDLAVLKFDPADLVLVGVDQVLEGVHFDRSIHSLSNIGKKAMNRNLSDCAAMACLPTAALISVALPKGFTIEQIKELYTGIKVAGEAFDCAIVGGDTGSWDQKLAISVSILGRSAGITLIRRNGAKVGDSIYVTGALGGSIHGRHLIFTPRVREARQLAQQHHLTAMIDISDGLSRDLRHICSESNVGALLQASFIPIHEDARKPSSGYSTQPLNRALHDGEDYELCFTSPDPDIKNAFRIGEIIAGQELLLSNGSQTSPLPMQSWQHDV